MNGSSSQAADNEHSPHTARDQRRGAISEQASRVERELARAREELVALGDHFAPSCYLEMLGADAAAERALRRARAPGEKGATLSGEEADREAERELEEAAAHVRRIVEHLARLGAAVHDVRGALAGAQAAGDEAHLRVSRRPSSDPFRAADEEALRRVSHLIDQARDYLNLARPDPLSALEAAERAERLARAIALDLASRPSVAPLASVAAGGATAPPAAVADGEAAAQAVAGVGTLQDEGQQAKAARDRALALLWTLAPEQMPATVLEDLRAVEPAYQAALERETCVAAQADQQLQEQGARVVAEAFRAVTVLAGRAHDAAQREIQLADERHRERYGNKPFTDNLLPRSVRRSGLFRRNG